MVEDWAEEEAKKATEIHNVDVSSMNFREGGKLVKTLPAVDLTTTEQQMAQRDPLVKNASGKFTDFLSVKAQNLTLVITVDRLRKGNPDLKMNAEYLKNNWTTTRVIKFVGLISKAFDDTEKNSSSTQSPMPDNSS